MTTSTKKADTPKKTVKNGKVYGDALSAAEKKKIVMQKKKDKKAKKIPKSAQQTIRSFSSGARICKKLTAPMVLPILKHLPSRKSKEVGAMKSFVLSPVRATMSKEKRNGSSVSMLNTS